MTYEWWIIKFNSFSEWSLGSQMALLPKLSNFFQDVCFFCKLNSRNFKLYKYDVTMADTQRMDVLCNETCIRLWNHSAHLYSSTMCWCVAKKECCLRYYLYTFSCHDSKFNHFSSIRTSKDEIFIFEYFDDLVWHK